MEKRSQICARVKISGLVQGVGYRMATWRQARRLGLTGWVRNLNDGRVEAVFEGLPEQVESMVQWCQIGPPSARVSQVNVALEQPQQYPEFEIFYE